MGFFSKIYLFFKPVKNSKVDQKKNTTVVINMEDEMKTLSVSKMMISEEELAEIQKNLDKCDPTRNNDTKFDLSKKEQKKQKERMARRFDHMCGLVYGGLPEKKGGLYVVIAIDSDLVKNKEQEKNDAEKEQKRIEGERTKTLANLQASKERRNAFRHRFKEREKP
jgi:hypothetical protein